MKYYIIVGEASGDIYGSKLIYELKKKDPQATFRFWGGNLMKEQSIGLVKHYRDLAFMGFWEVFRHLGTIFKNLAFAKKDILSFKPDILILIDYPGFNLRIASWAKKNRISVLYYVSPQVWAWKENRVRKMKLTIDALIVILPFEQDFYRNRWQWDVIFKGHPLVEIVDSTLLAKEEKMATTYNIQKPIIALLPGSRQQEIKTHLPIMLTLTKAYPEYQFIVAQAPGQSEKFYHQFLVNYPDVLGVTNQTYWLLQSSYAAIVSSGTATLETALFNVPQIVCYKGSWLSYWIAKRLIKLKYIALVNLILDKSIVTELIQGDCNSKKMRETLDIIVAKDSETRIKLLHEYKLLRKILAPHPNISEEIAMSVWQFARAKNQ